MICMQSRAICLHKSLISQAQSLALALADNAGGCLLSAACIRQGNSRADVCLRTALEVESVEDRRCSALRARRTSYRCELGHVGQRISHHHRCEHLLGRQVVVHVSAVAVAVAVAAAADVVGDGRCRGDAPLAEHVPTAADKGDLAVREADGADAAVVAAGWLGCSSNCYCHCSRVDDGGPGRADGGVGVDDVAHADARTAWTAWTALTDGSVANWDEIVLVISISEHGDHILILEVIDAKQEACHLHQTSHEQYMI